MYTPKRANLLEPRGKKPSIYRLNNLTLSIKPTIIDSSFIEIDKRSTLLEQPLKRERERLPKLAASF